MLFPPWLSLPFPISFNERAMQANVQLFSQVQTSLESIAQEDTRLRVIPGQYDDSGPGALYVQVGKSQLYTIDRRKGPRENIYDRYEGSELALAQRVRQTVEDIYSS